MSNHSGASNITLSRTLGLLDITMIGVGAMIGAGIFVLTGIAFPKQAGGIFGLKKAWGVLKDSWRVG